MAYATATDVYALTYSLVKPASAFDTTTCPTLTQINNWLSSGSAIINARIGVFGYAAIPADSAAYEIATQANALWAAWFAERSRLNARVSSDERTRADKFKDDFDALIAVLVTLDLSRLSMSQTGQTYVGGISRADTDTIEKDTDRVTPRFRRGVNDNPDRQSGGRYGG